MNKIALITGITGQDGFYLADLLLNKQYSVLGLLRRKAHFERNNLDVLKIKALNKNLRFELIYGEIEDSSSFQRTLQYCKPDEIYNLASQSHVNLSWQEPEYTTKTNSLFVLNILEAIRLTGIYPKIYNACSSELFGDPIEKPQTEETHFSPTTPYGVSKLYAYWMAKIYRERYDIFISNGIMFNHESPLRGENFVTRKITYSLARIKAGVQDKFYLGSYDNKRDWGFAGDYVRAMWLMLQQVKPDDFVIATGETHTVREFVEKAALNAGFNIMWEGAGVNEVGIDDITGKVIVAIDKKHFRPPESYVKVGDFSKAKNTLGWSPKVNFDKLVELMMNSDLKLSNTLHHKAL